MEIVLKLIKAAWRSIRISKRLYPLGTLGLSVMDNRTILEKLCDRIDDILSLIESKFKDKKRQTQAIWHSYWDICSGQWISGMSDIKRIEKERGWLSMTKNEVEQEAKRYDKANQERQSKHVGAYMNKCAKEISQGRSFIREQKERRLSGKDNLNIDRPSMNEGN